MYLATNPSDKPCTPPLALTSQWRRPLNNAHIHTSRPIGLANTTKMTYQRIETVTLVLHIKFGVSSSCRLREILGIVVCEKSWASSFARNLGHRRFSRMHAYHRSNTINNKNNTSEHRCSSFISRLVPSALVVCEKSCIMNMTECLTDRMTDRLRTITLDMHV